MGVQDAVGQGPGLRGLPRALVLLALRDAAVEHRDEDGRRLPRPAGSGGHGRAAAESASDPELDGAFALVWTTTPWTLPSNLAAAVHPDVELRAWCEARTGERYLLAEARRRRVRARAGRGAGRAARGSPARELRRHALHAAVRLLRRPQPNAHQILAADYVTTEDGTGIVHIAPAYGEEDKVVTDAAGIEPVTPVELARASSTRRCRRTQGSTSSRRTSRSSATSRSTRRARRAAAPRHVRPPVPALLALRQPADPARGELVVRRGHEVPRPDGRAEQADQLGARAHPRRPVRQVAGERARLVDLPQPVLGLADPGVGVGRPEATRASTSTARSTSSSATSACARPTCTARTSTS